MLVPSRLPLIAALALSASACSDYSSTIGPEHCGAIDGDQIWGRDLNPHDVTCDVTITGDLVVGPGVRVRFAPGTTLIVQGSLSVEGTAERPVTFEPAEDGRGWNGVWVPPFEQQNEVIRPNPEENPAFVPQGDVSLSHLVIKGAGLTPSGTAFQPGALIIDRGPVHLSEVTLESALQCGLSIGEQGRIAADAGTITITDSNLSPVCAHPASVSSLPDTIQADEGTSFDVREGALRGTHVWRDVGTPYRLVGDLEVFRADLTLDAGLTVQVMPEVRIMVGDDAEGPVFGDAPNNQQPYRRTQGSHLRAAGTQSSPVTLTLAETGSSNSYWGGLFVDGDDGESSVLLENTVIDRAGAAISNDPGAITVTRSGRVTVDSVTIQDGGGAGVVLKDSGVFTPDSRALQIIGNAYAAVVAPDAVFSLPGDGSRYTGNGVVEPSSGTRAKGDLVYVTPGQITQSGVLRDIDIPYYIEGDLQVRNTGSESVDLQIQPGVAMRFASRASFEVGTSGSCTLLAGSATGDAITMIADPSLPDGARLWGGLELGNNLKAGAQLHNVVLTDAGVGEGQGLRVQALDVDIDGVTIEAPTLDSGVTTGLRLSGTFSETSRGLVIRGADIAVESQINSIASIPEEGADLTGNEGAYVLSDGGQFGMTGSWGDLGVPYRIEEQVYINGEIDADERIFSARLTLEPGVVVEFGETAAFRTERFGNDRGDYGHGTLAAIGTVADPVVLTASVPTDGWTGLIFRDEDVRLQAIGDGDPTFFPIAERSTLQNVIVEHGASLFSFANITYDSATLNVVNVTSRDSKRYGVSLIGDAYAESRDGVVPPNRCELFTRAPYTFINNNGGDDGTTENDVLDFRVFIKTDC